MHFQAARHERTIKSLSTLPSSETWLLQLIVVKVPVKAVAGIGVLLVILSPTWDSPLIKYVWLLNVSLLGAAPPLALCRQSVYTGLLTNVGMWWM
jgi:predicted Abi (CAAX) family protease